MLSADLNDVIHFVPSSFFLSHSFKQASLETLVCPRNYKFLRTKTEEALFLIPCPPLECIMHGSGVCGGRMVDILSNWVQNKGKYVE